MIEPSTLEKVQAAIDVQRLLDTAVKLIEIPSPTRSAAEVADRLAGILVEEGFEVERPEAGWPDAPAVAGWMRSGTDGRTLQLNGHLDTVHLPFVAPRIENGNLYGSGCSDMKGGIAASVEAMRALRDSGVLQRGNILLTAHDLHEAPWGDGSQVDGLIDAGFVGDGVLLPEYFCESLPIVGRGLAVFEIEATRGGEAVHETLGGAEQPNVIQAGADLIQRFADADRELGRKCDPLAGRESYFIGQVHSGEIYNQSPTSLRMSGTRRWLPGTDADGTEAAWRSLIAATAEAHAVSVEGQYQIIRDAFRIDADSPLALAFQAAHESATGSRLESGAKPFVDDANTFIARGGVTAITHGPRATGAHTLNEVAPISELERVALVYALTAMEFC